MSAGVPDPPENVEILRCNKSMAVIEWTPGFDNHDPITGKILLLLSSMPMKLNDHVIIYIKSYLIKKFKQINFNKY